MCYIRVMVVPTSARTDRSVASITVRLDNKNTDVLKKFHCSVCGHVVFGYYDTVVMLLPGDDVGDALKEHKNAVDEIICLYNWVDDKGHRDRCKTTYVLDRG